MKVNIFRVLSLTIIIVGLFLSVSCNNQSSENLTPKQTEIIELRNESSKTWDLGDGKRAVDSVIGSIHYKNDYNDDTEQWKEIDPTIVDGRVDKAPYILTIDGYAITVKDKKTSAVTTIKLDDIDGQQVEGKVPVYKGNTALFEDVAKDTDIEITATNTHVYFKRVLKSSDAPLTATFDVAQSGDSITVTPYARERASYTDIKVVSRFENGKLTETIEQYKIASLTYPIEIDPTIDVTVSASSDDCDVYWTGAAWTIEALNNNDIAAGYFDAGHYKYGSGLRFLNITVPFGAIINDSYLNITAFSNYAITTVNSTIIGDKELTAATFSTLADYQARRGTIVGGATNNFITATSVNWDNIGAWTTNTTYTSTNITPVVQEIVNQVGWGSGNPLALFWDDHADRSTHVNNAIRLGWSYDGAGAATARRPTLRIVYTGVTGPTVNTLRCTGFGQNWLLFNGNVTSYGGTVNITQLGFNYGATNAYGASAETIYTNYTITSYGYYSYINGLNTQTVYHYKANAYNGAWGYGGDKQFSTSGASLLNSMEWESNIATVNTTWNTTGSNWTMQLFSTNDTAHTITNVDLWLKRNNSPGDVTVVLQQASGGLPYGTALSTGTIAAQYTGNINPVSTNLTTRYTVPMVPEVSLSANTSYCVTIKALMGDTSNYLQVANVNTGTYGYGSGYTSNNNGQTWTDTGTSFLFDLWGHACLQVDQAKVFNSYKDTGDWVIVFFYRNVFPPWYPIQDSKQYFVYQLVDQYNNVKAQQSCTAWGARPGSIYLSAATVSPLQWSGAYRVRLVNLRDGTVYMEYPLQSGDWMGTDLSLLDAWVTSMAQQLQVYDNVPYIVAVAGRGNVLNSAGGVIFATGIPLLDTIRPNLFQIVSQSPISPAVTFPQTMRQKYTPALMLGTDAWATMVSIGNIFGVDGRTIGAIGIMAVIAVIAGWGFQPGHTVAATVLSFPILILGMLVGVIDLLIGAFALAICLGIFLWRIILPGG